MIECGGAVSRPRRLFRRFNTFNPRSRPSAAATPLRLSCRLTNKTNEQVNASHQPSSPCQDQISRYLVNEKFNDIQRIIATVLRNHWHSESEFGLNRLGVLSRPFKLPRSSLTYSKQEKFAWSRVAWAAAGVPGYITHPPPL